MIEQLTAVGMVSLALVAGAAPNLSLEEGFRCPPRTARPHVWYHLMNGNVTKAGITRDFEAIAAVGLGGVQMFDAGCDIPEGPLQFNTPEWYDLLRHAVTEAQRLGLEVCLPNCSGWSCAGGPWITETNCMKGVAFAETGVLKGPSRFSEALPRPAGRRYRDVAVLAYPVPVAELRETGTPHVTLDGLSATWEVERPTSFAGFSVRLKAVSPFAAVADMTVEASEDGRAFRPVFVRADVPWGDEGSSFRVSRYFPFDRPVRARSFRLTLKQKEYGKVGDIAAFCPETMRKVADLPGKTCAIRQLPSAAPDRQGCEEGAVRKVPARDQVPAQADEAVPIEKIVDLTARLGEDGRLDWDIPAGDWRILRFGFVSKPNSVHPASKNGRGLEVDKLDGQALDYHFEQYLGKVCDLLGKKAVGKNRPGLAGTLVDSYEAGSQNWTEGLERVFAERMGYDPRPYLPAFAGRIVGSVEMTERFFEDFKRLVGTLFCENFADRLVALCRARGIACSIEPFGNASVDNLRYGQNVDIPMGEMWSDGLKRRLHPGNSKLAAYIAHFWGRRYCGSEAFTAGWPYAGRFRTTPYAIKAQGDLAYVNGVNRIIYHRFAHQPWTARDYFPGMTMGQWGMCFDRTQTWWFEQKEWIAYQSRCQWMLQEGRFVADALYFQGEEVPNRADAEPPCDGRPSRARYPKGIDYDWCSREGILALKVERGRLVAPGGVRYRLLVLPDSDTMSAAVLEKIGALVEAGAKVCAVRRPSRFPGLKGWPEGNARFARRVKDVWAKGVREMNAAAALERLGVTPDVVAIASSQAESVSDYPRFGWIHRTDGDRDWYFISCANDREETLTVSFRQTGRAVELWDAETGEIRRAVRVKETDARTEVSFDLRPNGSMFVMFRPTSSASFERRFAETRVIPVEGPWKLSFPKGWGAPNSVTLDELVDWTKHADSGVNYFSGTATYEKRVDLSSLQPLKRNERLLLDLGDVKHFASVEVNGKAFPAMWRPPFRVDVTEAVAGAKRADVKIRVTNLWSNRLIGDERMFKPDCEWSPAGRGRGIAAIPDWVKRGEKSPTGRYTFCTWRHWTAEDDLLPSGMLGPARLLVEKEIEGRKGSSR